MLTRSYELAAHVRLTCVMTHPRLKRTLWLDSFDDERLEDSEDPQESEGKSSSDKRGEIGPGDVDRDERHDTSLVLLQGGLER